MKASSGPDLDQSQASDRVPRVDDFLSPVSMDERKDPLGAHPAETRSGAATKGS